MLRRVWIADLIAVVMVASEGLFLDFTNPYRFAVTAVAYLLWSFGLLWLLRRFGFLAVLAFWFADQIIVILLAGQLTSWYAGRTLVGIGIVVALAAWALWTVLAAAQHRPASASTP